MTRAAVYTRISKDDADDRLGVDRQERECRALAKRHGLSVVTVLTDNDVSAYNGSRRPGFEELVASIERGEVDAVIAYHADRLYRRTTDLERLVDVVEAHGAAVHTAAAGTIDLGTASGRMVARMLGAAAQHESERLGERLRLKSDELAAAGKAPGGRPPYGYKRAQVDPAASGSGYVVNLDEAEVVRRIARRILEGRSLLGVTRELNADGIPTREGRPWHHATVRAVVQNPAVAGLRVHRREVAGPGVWEPILDRATWEQVRAVVADPARKHTRPAFKYLLTGGLAVSAGGDKLIGKPGRGAGGKRDRRTYVAESSADRRAVMPLQVGADDLEAAVIEMVLLALDESAMPAAPRVPEVGAAVVAVEAELAELAKLRGEGTISMGEWLAARGPLLERLAEAQATAHPTRPAKLDRLLGQPGAARKAWPSLDFAARRAVIEAVLERVVVGPATRARWTAIEERLDPAKGYGPVWRA